MKAGPLHTNRRAIRFPWRAAIVVGLLAGAALLHRLELLDWERVLEQCRLHAYAWWMPLALIAAQIVTYALALFGSGFLWIAALLYPPPLATLILVAGNTLGGLGAYTIARTLTGPWQSALRRRRLYRLLSRHGDFLTLCSLRLLPGFPQSAINYSSGLLRIPVGQFTASAVLGLTVKTLLYTDLIDRLVERPHPAALLRSEIIVPLVILAILFAAARLFQRRWSRSP